MSRLHPLILLGGYQGKKLLPVPDVFDRTDFDNTTQVMFFDLGEDVSTCVGGEGRRVHVLVGRRCEYRCWRGEDVSTGVGGEKM